MSTADRPPAPAPMADTDRPSPAPALEPGEETNQVQHNATEWLEETMEHPEETIEETAQETLQGWDRVEMAAVITVVAVLTAACGWSAIALHGLARQSGVTSWLAWGAPIIVDGPLFQSAIALVVLKRRANAGVIVEPRHKWFFWWMLAASELISLIGNGAHAAKVPVTPLISAIIAGAAPVAAMAVMHGFTILIEVPRKPAPHAQAGNREQATLATDFDTSQVLTPVVSVGDGTSSPTVSTPSPTRLQEATEETPPVSYPSPGDTDPAAQETAGSPEERDAAVWALHQGGKSLREIAEITDLSKGYVGKILARLKAEHAADDSEQATDDGTGVVLKFVR
ncbi:MAG: hypothetical protein JWN03_6668 [Nocardia sp.]|uniref:DUF2637 domain-containing protein n=1 Tax=Nocardia sp. TaxID=1821 RepID=UPI0026028FBC|nr:DUF2637 domain-containing protein [Nocardia sp.]MCU1646393.1 hypothetical protein [Nocardia sp.]